jgi:CSLREA domain-containing protein
MLLMFAMTGANAQMLTLVTGTTFTVNATFDAVDTSPGDGKCMTSYPGPGGLPACTLRAAIQEVNALTSGGPFTIILPKNRYYLSIPPGYDDQTTGDVDIYKSVTIKGAGMNDSVIDANLIDRVLEVKQGATVDITGVGFTRGKTGSGGGILNYGTLTLSSSAVFENLASSPTGASGGGIENDYGVLKLLSTRVEKNRVRSGWGAFGGGICSFGGQIELSNTTLSQNFVSGDEFSSGGALFNGGSAVITGSTISLNVADEVRNGLGGGIYTQNFSFTVVNSTISSNTARLGSAIFTKDGSATLRSSTVAANVGTPSVYVTSEYFSSAIYIRASIIDQKESGCGPEKTPFIVSEGYNIDSGGSCRFFGRGDQFPKDPLLGPLQDNGGPTQTHALLPGSPAVDLIPQYEVLNSPGFVPSMDQRGIARPQFPGTGTAYTTATSRLYDAGAYEAVPAPRLSLF